MDELKQGDVTFLTAESRVETPMGMLGELPIGMGKYETPIHAMVMSAATMCLWTVICMHGFGRDVPEQ